MKLDLHIHTSKTILDPEFDFDMDVLEGYVKRNEFGGIAITNHNVFDLSQFKEIRHRLNGACEVLPGIEISVGTKAVGHLLCIANPEDVEDFSACCQRVKEIIKDIHSFITPSNLKSIFRDMSKYLWISHYDKSPELDQDAFSELREYISFGEVGSIKKFVRHRKDSNSLPPVLFSDYRPEADKEMPISGMYFDISNVNIRAIKACAEDRTKIGISKEEINDTFDVLPDIAISTGLNLVIGERSSGKTYFLDEIMSAHPKAKYIQQFSLTASTGEGEKKLEDSILGEQSREVDRYFENFKDVVDDVEGISLEADEAKVEEYIKTLLKYAADNSRRDVFSKCRLFSENKYDIGSQETIKNLLDATSALYLAKSYRALIDQYISRDTLGKLINALIDTMLKEREDIFRKKHANAIIDDIQSELCMKTASIQLKDIDFFQVAYNRAKVEKFRRIAEAIRRPECINSYGTGRFVVRLNKGKFTGAQEMKNTSHRKNTSFSKHINKYDDPYNFLNSLKGDDSIPKSEYYKYFAKIEIEILNQYGVKISGGERAEYNLLREIRDATQYELLLIDEPESSFDNIFLSQQVNKTIKDLSNILPVVVVTHSSSIGGSIGADYIIHTKRKIIDGNPFYERYYGLSSDKTLVSNDGDQIRNYGVAMECLEAGEDAYNERSKTYALLKD